jgi:alpha-glucosidase
VGVCLYVEAGKTLRSHNLDSLFAHYASWGLAGLKPGFVKYGTQENTNWIRDMVKTAAKHHLLLCIHDARIPEGMSRTYPNLVINEGGGGQEKNHPVVQDVMLPFSRCLAGPFDYTPFIYTRGKSNAHMLSFFVTYFGPAQTVRGAYVAWNADGKFGKGGEELEFLRRVPATWDDTKVLSAKIGRHLITARKSGSSWFVGGMTGDEAFSAKLALTFLDPDKNYKMTTFSDHTDGFSDGWCQTKKDNKTVNSDNELSVDMLSSGGFVAIFDLVE